MSRHDLAAINCLIYAQTSLYNELSAKTMMYRLRLNHVPPSLFQDKLFVQHKYSLQCTYKTRDEQSYFKNPKFLFTNASARHKVVYLKALGMRRVSEKVDYIPLKYFDNVKYNPFLHIEDGKIYFPLESSV